MKPGSDSISISPVSKPPRDVAARGEKSDSDPRFVRVCHIDDVPRLGSRVIQRSTCNRDNIALFRTSDDRVFALRDRCPHKGGPLSQGIVFGDRVACPLHNWTIELASGCAVAPDQGCARPFDVRIDDGGVYLAVGNVD